MDRYNVHVGFKYILQLWEAKTCVLHVGFKYILQLWEAKTCVQHVC